MFNDNNKRIHRPSSVQPADSFVIDLRSALNRAETAVKKVDDFCAPKPELPKKKKENKSSNTMADFVSGLKPAAKSLLSEKKKHSHSFAGLFISPRRYRWRMASLFASKKYRLPSDLKQARKHFAHAAAIEWKKMVMSKLIKGKKSKEASAEILVNWYRSLFAFIAALIFIILPFKLLAYFKILDLGNLKDNIINSSFSAFDNLAVASDEASQLDLASAGSSFARAASDFSSAQAELSRVDDWLFSLASFSNDPKIKLASSGKKFLAAGQAGAIFGQQLSAAGEVFLGSQDDRSWGKLIDAFVDHGQPALTAARDLQGVLATISVNDLPEEYRDRFLSFRVQADLAVEALDTLVNSAQELKAFIGVSQDKRYLLVFQNNTEMRGAGGFLGSYALVDIRDGNIRKLEVPAGGSYDTEAGMTSFIRSPRPLWLVNPRWYLWDANWWPDWPTSARSLMWFYEKSDGPTVDGVISFTPDVLEDLLRITGPIDLRPNYDLTVDADNFWELIQATVEKDNLEKTHPDAVSTLPDSPKNMPKKIIGDLMAEIMERLPQVLTADNAPALIQALERNLSAKNIMLYFTDPALQEKAARYHLDGAMAPTKQDYLLIAHTNIAGQKSDRRMEEEVSHSAQIMTDGSIIDTLTIRRTHTGIKNEMLTGVRNVDWLRVYVPAGSQLLSADGFESPDASYFDVPEESWQSYPFVAETEELGTTDLRSGTKIYQENGKTVFANWAMTDPGETTEIHFRYRLPFRLEKSETEIGFWSKIDSILNQKSRERSSYSLLWQKQPGAKPIKTDLQLKLPTVWRSVWNYPENSAYDGEAVLNRDLIRATLIEK